jgi:hypothetical protein
MASRWVIQSQYVPLTVKRTLSLAGINSTIVNLRAQVYHLAGTVNPVDPFTKPMKDDNLMGTVLHTYETFLRASQKLDPTVMSILDDDFYRSIERGKQQHKEYKDKKQQKEAKARARLPEAMVVGAFKATKASYTNPKAIWVKKS